MATVLERLAGSLTRLDADALAPADRDILLNHLIDSVGASLAGTRIADGQAALGFDAGAALAGRRSRTAAPLDAIAARVAATRATEIDDIHMASCTTPGSVVVPSVLTLMAARPEVAGDALRAALLAGYTAMTGLGTAIGGAAILYRGIWPTYFCAPFAAAAAAGRLLGLASETMTHALAIALSMASGGTGRPRGVPAARWLLVGNAARSGTLAALAAAEGVKGDTTLLDGDWLKATHGIDADPQALADIDGGAILRSLSLKPWCAAKQAMAAIHGMREIVGNGVAPAAIQSVRVFVPPAYAGMIGHQATAGVRVSTITSAPWQMALATLRPEKLDDVARSETSADAEVSALAARISIAADEGMSHHWPARYPARVVVTAGGATHERLVLDVPGDPAMPLDRAAVLTKFVRFAGRGARATALRDAALAAFDEPDGPARLAAAYGRAMANARRRRSS